jgi:hypothetical protein
MAAIRAHSYDARRNELTVTFATGRVYVYALVPPAVADAFAAAASQGSYLNRHIRDRYPTRRIAAIAGEAEAASAASGDLRRALAASLGKDGSS